MIFCLRLAILLHRTRDDRVLPAWRVTALTNGFQLDLPAEWLLANPLTAAALREEVAVWQQAGRDFLVKSRSPRKAA